MIVFMKTISIQNGFLLYVHIIKGECRLLESQVRKKTKWYSFDGTIRKKTVALATAVALLASISSTGWMVHSTNAANGSNPTNDLASNPPLQLAANLSSASTQAVTPQPLPNSIRPYKKGIQIRSELANRRTRNSDTVQNSDGTLTTMMASEPLNYFSNGRFHPIDNRIVQSKVNTNEYNMLHNQFTVRFPKRMGQSLTYTLNNHRVMYRALNTSGSAGIVDGSSITYPGAWNRTDLQYVSANEGLKMNIILRDKSAPTQFSFLIDAGGLLLKRKGNTLQFMDAKGNYQFGIPEIWVVDASSKKPRYDRVQTSVILVGSKYKLTFSLNAKGLVYPITIDPTTKGEYLTAAHKLYMDIYPNVFVKDLEMIRFENVGSNGTNGGRSVKTYITKSEYGAFRGEGSDTLVAPGDDGKSVLYLGDANMTNANATGNAYREVSGDTIRSLWGNSDGTIFGGAVFDKDYIISKAWMYVTYRETAGNKMYQYDGSDRLMSVSYLDSALNYHKTSFTYDNNGNLLTQRSTASNWLIADGDPHEWDDRSLIVEDGYNDWINGGVSDPEQDIRSVHSYHTSDTLFICLELGRLENYPNLLPHTNNNDDYIIYLMSNNGNDPKSSYSRKGTKLGSYNNADFQAAYEIASWHVNDVTVHQSNGSGGWNWKWTGTNIYNGIGKKTFLNSAGKTVTSAYLELRIPLSSLPNADLDHMVILAGTDAQDKDVARNVQP